MYWFDASFLYFPIFYLLLFKMGNCFFLSLIFNFFVELQNDAPIFLLPFLLFPWQVFFYFFLLFCSFSFTFVFIYFFFTMENCFCLFPIFSLFFVVTRKHTKLFLLPSLSFLGYFFFSFAVYFLYLPFFVHDGKLLLSVSYILSFLRRGTKKKHK